MLKYDVTPAGSKGSFRTDENLSHTFRAGSVNLPAIGFVSEL